MESSFFIITFITGLIIGFFVAFIVNNFRNKNSAKNHELHNSLEQLKVENLVRKEQLESGNNALKELENKLNESRKTIIDLTAALSSEKSDFRNLETRLSDQKKELEEIREKFVYEFTSIANEILVRESKVFTEQNKTNLDLLLKPLGEKIKDFEKKVDEVYDRESKQRFSLKEEVKRLSELNQQISKDAQNLVSALKGQSKTQGNWGELILENILEKSGLEKGREFQVQKSYKAEDGKRLQPDVILTLPGDKNVVIDSKVSLNAYESYASAEEEISRQAALRNHLLSVKKHIDELSSKNYQHLYELNSLDFVIMFMPVEPAFMEAIKNDPELWNYAYEKGVLLIGPTNLFATLKMVASIWQQEYQNRNVIEIAAESGKLYDKFVGFLKDIENIGEKLQATQVSYDKAMNKLSTGRGNLISKAEKIKNLGAKTSTEIPKSLLSKND